MTALLIGSLADRTLAAVAAGMARRSSSATEYLDVVALQLGGAVATGVQDDGTLDVRVAIAGRERHLASYARVLCRWIEVAPAAPTPKDEAGARSLYQGLGTALAHLSVPVMNRPFQHRSLCSKLDQVIRFRRPGAWATPRTVLTTDFAVLQDFLESCPEGAIVKGASSHKTWVARLDLATATERRHLLGPTPLLVQEYLPGHDVRVHVVGDRCFAEAIHSERDDYRLDRSASYAALELPPRIAAACVELTSELGLYLSGIDFRVREDRWTFLEINPLPDLWGYDRRAGGSIVGAICDWLAA